MASIVESCGGQYTPTQIDAWGRRPFDEAARLAAIASSIVWVVTDVAMDATEVEGFGRLVMSTGGADGTAVKADVAQLYLRRRAQGAGAGKALLRTLEACALAGGADRVTLNASHTALPFYLSQGYVVAGPLVAFPLPSGVTIESTPLVKDLVPSRRSGSGGSSSPTHHATAEESEPTR